MSMGCQPAVQVDEPFGVAGQLGIPFDSHVDHDLVVHRKSHRPVSQHAEQVIPGTRRGQSPLPVDGIRRRQPWRKTRHQVLAPRQQGAVGPVAGVVVTLQARIGHHGEEQRLRRQRDALAVGRLPEEAQVAGLLPAAIPQVQPIDALRQRHRLLGDPECRVEHQHVIQLQGSGCRGVVVFDGEGIVPRLGHQERRIGLDAERPLQRRHRAPVERRRGRHGAGGGFVGAPEVAAGEGHELEAVRRGERLVRHLHGDELRIRAAVCAAVCPPPSCRPRCRRLRPCAGG